MAIASSSTTSRSRSTIAREGEGDEPPAHRLQVGAVGGGRSLDRAGEGYVLAVPPGQPIFARVASDLHQEVPMSQPALLSRIHALYASIQRAGAAAPPELKQLVADFARPLRQRGDTWAQVAAQLPVSVTAARAWLHAHPLETSLVAVSIRDDATSCAAIEALVLVSPAGYRLEGLHIEQAAHLMGLLR